MSMWYPIDGSDLSGVPVEGGTNMPLAINPEDAPTADGLSDWIQTEKDLDLDMSLSLGFAPFSLDEKGDHRTIVLDTMRYVDKGNVRWGVGVRYTLHAWTDNGTIKGSVALVAAQATLNLAYTRSTFQVLGYDSPDLQSCFPGFEEMSVSNYAQLMKSIDACRAQIGRAAPGELRLQPVAFAAPAARKPDVPDEPHRWIWHLHKS
jgi:hypothetical protein